MCHLWKIHRGKTTLRKLTAVAEESMAEVTTKGARWLGRGGFQRM